MSAEKATPDRETLTYFGPLKDENLLPNTSNVLQFVYNFFSSKRGSEARKKIQEPAEKNTEKPSPRPKVLDFGTQKAQKRKLVANSTHHDPGSEVELRLRSISSMLKDFPKLMKSSQPNDQVENGGLQDGEMSPSTSNTELRQYWMPDEKCHECYECGEKFTTFRRRHHCRICGHIFCSRCCNQLISGKFMGYSGMLRSCTYCCNLVLTFAQGNVKSIPHGLMHSSTTTGPDMTIDDSSRDNSTIGDSTLSPGNVLSLLQSSSANTLRRHSQNSGKFRHDTTPAEERPFALGPIHPSAITSPGKDILGRKPTVDIFDATPDISRSPEPDSESSNDLVQDSAQLHELWRKVKDEKDGIEFRDHRFRLRKYSSCITGQELVDWLLQKDVAYTRPQACAIGQALFDGKWLKSVTDIGGVFQDGYILFQSGQKTSMTTGSNKIEIFPDHFANFSDEGEGDSVYTLVDQEPIWVQEIQLEDEVEEDRLDGIYKDGAEPEMIWKDAQMNFDDSLIYSDDDKSISEKSVFSLSSFVEIDEENDVIKYRRQSSLMNTSSTGGQPRLHSPQPSFDDSCLTSISADYLRNFLTWHGTSLNQPWLAPSSGWRVADLQSAFIQSRDKRAFQWLREVYLHHNLSFLKQLLIDKDLDLAWAEVLVPLARHAADSVTPDPDVNIDICHYVQIKKVLDGPRMESQLINGIVCTKNVVHKQMQTDIHDPAILLLAIPLEYQRIQLKLATLDPIVRQEREFYKHLISRITSRQPQIVLVQCTVSHIAQDLLLRAGITLVINVKPSVMERVARCTEADIVYSIDQLMQAKLGQCARFYIKHHILNTSNFHDSEPSKGTKTLMYFDGCKPCHGCTIVLRKLPNGQLHYDQGGHELIQVQKVLRFLIQAMYHGRLELTYLIDHQDFGQLLHKGGNKGLLQKERVESESSPKRANAVVEGSLNTANGLKTMSVSADAKFRKISGCDDAPSVYPAVFDPELDNDGGSSLGSGNRSPYYKKEPAPNPAMFHDKQNKTGVSSSCSAFLNSLKSTLLCTSPMCKIKLPFLFTELGTKSELRHYLPNKLFWSRKSPKLQIDEIENYGKDIQKAFRSRSSTMESQVAEKNWLSPPRNNHKGELAADYDDSTISLETLGNSIGSHDALDEATSTPTIRKECVDPRSSCYSQHFKCHQRDVSLGSADSVTGAIVAMKLHTWEQKLMDQVFPSTTNKQMVSTPILSPDSNHIPKFKNTRPQSVHSRQKKDKVLSETSFFLPPHKLVLEPLTLPANSIDVKNLLANYRANAGMASFPEMKPSYKFVLDAVDERVKSDEAKVQLPVEKEPSFPSLMPEHLTSVSSPPDCLDPINHQHICALFSSYSTQSPNAPYPCVFPWVVDIEFYRGNDITLGGFLERYCFRPSYHCPNATCRRPMVEHVRSFVHGNMCLTIVLKELSKPFQHSSILTWNWNHITRKPTEIKTMSHDAWSMSFAKYLELRLEVFDAPESFSKDSSSDEKVNILDQEFEIAQFTCHQYFLFRDIVASFKCFSVNINEVIFPAHTLLNLEKDSLFYTCQLLDEFEDKCSFFLTAKSLSEKIYDVLDSVSTCIKTCSSNRVGDSPSEEMQLSRERFFDDLQAMLSEDRNRLREELDSLQLISTENFQDANFEDSWDEPNEDCVIQNEALTKSFSMRVLQLKCEICRLVQFWNSKLEEASEGYRSSNWGVTSLSMQQKKLALDSPAIPEADAAPFSSVSNRMPVDSAKKSTEEDSCSLASLEPSSTIMQEKPPPTPVKRSVSRQSRTLSSAESKSLEKSNSYKKMSRTGSSVRLLVTRLLPGNTLVPSVPQPFPAEEHYLLPECLQTNIVVRDSEPASIIAYTLSSEKYKLAIKDMSSRTDEMGENGNCNSYNADDPEVLQKRPPTITVSSRSSSPSDLLRLSDNHSTGSILQSDENRGVSDNSVTSISTKSRSTSPTSISSPHVELQFSDDTTKFYCKVYFATTFAALRAKVLVGGELQYIESMSRSMRWVARGGKSGSTFYKTRDDQFIMKQMSYFELQSFLEFAPKYVDYVTASINNQEPTTISKILGVYRISFRNSETNRSMKQDFLIIENLFYRRKITQIFDLKGSVRNRHVKADSTGATSENGCIVENSDIVLLDENLLKLMGENPIYVHEHAKHLLKSAITRDTNFLSSHLIMDYSLLVGVEEDNQIVVGIIDYIRTFTWDKKLEMVVKSYGMFGSRKQSNRSMPTVVSPELYKNRFCEAMDRYFQVVPDRWYGMHAY